MLSERYGKALIVLITIAAFSLGGSTQVWAKGILFAAMGTTVLLAPPTRLPRWSITLPIILFLIWAATAFLPASFGGSPDWRRALTEDFRLPLAGMITAQPWVSLEAFMTLLASGLWALYLMGQRWDDAERRLALRVLCWAITILAAVALACHFSKIWIKYWGSFHNLGPFPNRNHFASLLSVGAVLAATCAYDINRRRGRWWPLYTIPLAILFVAIVINNSRAGVVLFFGGLMAWLILVSVASKSTARIAIAGSILIIAAAGFFAFGGGLLDRFALNREFVSTLSADGRVPIYLDSLSLAAQSPVFGTGIGNFEGVFSMSQTHYWNNDNRAIHPESDWVWILVEMGIPAVLLAALGIFAVIKSFGGIRPRRDSLRHQHRLRAGALVAGLLTPLHATFDIPGHVLGTALPALLLLSLSTNRRAYAAPSGFAPQLVRAGSIPIFAAAALAGGLHLTDIPIPSKTGALQAYGKSVKASAIDPAAAYDLATQAASWAPLQWEYYFMRATQSIAAGKGFRAAQADFRRARFLEQQSPALAVEEAKFWLQHRPALALPAWREVLERDPTRLEERYHHMLAAMRSHPELTEPIKALAKTSPRLRLQMLGNVAKTEFPAELQRFLKDDPELETLGPTEKKRLFDLWARWGDRAELLAALEGNRSWMDAGWMHAASAKAKAGDFHAAAEMARKFIPEPPIPTPPPGHSLVKLEQDFYLNPTDAARGLAVWSAQINAGKPAAALKTIEKVSNLPQAPPSCRYLQAKTLLATKDYRAAWEAFQEYRSKS